MDRIEEAFTEGVPDGARVSGVRAVALPPRTWVKLSDGDGTEIYLDADENAQFVVRTVRPGPRSGEWTQDASDGTPTLPARSVIEVRDPA